MGGTFAVTMGDRGRLVVPAPLRAAAGLSDGAPLVLVDTSGGVLMMTREQALAHLRHQLAGRDLVADLLAERRASAAGEDR